MAKDGRFFKVDEFKCKHCGYNVVKQELIDLADKVRANWGGPLRVNSGCRCKEHNKAVGGVPSSNHITGEAVDLYPMNGKVDALWRFIRNMALDGELQNLAGLGRYDTFVHVDIAPRIGRLREWDERKA